jgi:hypothetical protein
VFLLAADACGTQSTSGTRIVRNGIQVIQTFHPKEYSREESVLGRGLLSSSAAAVLEKSVHIGPCRRSTSRLLPAAGQEESEP